MKKKHLAALLSALVIPGAGQLYSRHFVKGAVLVLASAGLVASLVYKTWDAAMRAMAGVAPENMQGSLVPIAQAVAESNRGFYNTVTLIFIFVWAAGVIDAWVTGSGEPVGSKKEV